MDPAEPMVLLLGSIDGEGVLSALNTAGRQYKSKRLESLPANWESILEYFGKYRVRAVVAKISSLAYKHFASPEYADVRERLISQLKPVPHALFVYEDLLRPKSFEAEEGDLSYFRDVSDEERALVNTLFRDAKLNVVPFRRSAEVVVLASAFINDVEGGLIFRVYVPSGRIWADQTDKLLQLFRDYLSRVGHKSVRLDQHRTEHGIVYEFFRSPDDNAESHAISLSSEFEEFSHLLDLSVADPAAAEALLQSRQIDQREIAALLTRYGKEARRLQVDIRQEREQKLLGIRHRLESELVDVLPNDVAWSTVDSLVDGVIPRIDGMNTLRPTDPPPKQIGAAAGGPVTINLKPQFIQAINSVVAQELSGDVHLSAEETQILELVHRFGWGEKSELASAVRELADDSAPRPGRLFAKQKVKAFLLQAAGKIPEVAVSLLTSYLEKRYGLS